MIMGEYSELARRVVKSMNNFKSEKLIGTTVQHKYDPHEIASLIDHTNLNPDAVEQDIIRLCNEADEYGFASAVAQPCWTSAIKNNLQNPDVKICGIAGFPLGGHTTGVKAAEAARCVDDGADDVDMVINIGWVKQASWKSVEDDISQVVKAVDVSTTVKVIIECCLLTDEEKIKASLCTVNAGAHFVKSSTGFSKWGAKASDIALMRKVVGDDFGVKASGGIRTTDAIIEMIDAGADRIGTSSGVQIVKNLMTGEE